MKDVAAVRAVLHAGRGNGHKPEGVYHLVVFEASPETLSEATRVLKITDGVIRHLAVRHIEGSRTSAPPRDETPAPREETATEPDYASAAVVPQDSEEEA